MRKTKKKDCVIQYTLQKQTNAKYNKIPKMTRKKLSESDYFSFFIQYILGLQERRLIYHPGVSRYAHEKLERQRRNKVSCTTGPGGLAVRRHRIEGGVDKTKSRGRRTP